ncbi:MAG: hypothetical protein K2F96_05460, partial [Muribaculaceae bacterium]|nr:hypothetical protein [Muribaculaceae bacterium]
QRCNPFLFDAQSRRPQRICRELRTTFGQTKKFREICNAPIPPSPGSDGALHTKAFTRRLILD